MVHQRSEVPGGVYYFISLETKSKAPVFKDAFFKTVVERRWTAHLHPYPHTRIHEFVVNDSALHAILHMTPEVRAPEQQLDEIITTFQAALLADWKEDGELWNPKPKIRRINTQEDLRSLRGFIVQKMLGGKELSRLEELDEDEDDGYHAYHHGGNGDG
jgi:hypothetical protein